MAKRWLVFVTLVAALIGLTAAVADIGASGGEWVAPRREVRSFHLYATDGYLETTDGKTLYIWGYSLENRPGSATLPGPLLEVNEGDIVKITLTNLGPSREGVHRVPHTVHLHGLDVNQENDGVPHTAASVRVGQSFTYVFEATHAGTYWYHCHVDTVEHLTMGMYGALVVRAAGGARTAWTGGPAFDREYTLLLSELDPAWSQAVAEDQPADLTRFVPRYFFINGKSFPDLVDDPTTHVRGYLGERVLIRLINAGYGWRSMHMHGFHFEVIASDGRPLPQPYLKDTLSLAPGERYDILVTLDQRGAYPFHSHVILDNMNDGRYPGGLHTMVTVLEPGEPLTADAHAHDEPAVGEPAAGEPAASSGGEAQPDGHAPDARGDDENAPPRADAPNTSLPNAFSGFGFAGPAFRPAADPRSTEAEQAAPGDVEITMRDDRFHPERLLVPAGSTVTWVNADPRTHSVVAAQFESPDIARHERWSRTFDQPGVYVYECAHHRGMTGVIEVR